MSYQSYRYSNQVLCLLIGTLFITSILASATNDEDIYKSKWSKSNKIKHPAVYYKEDYVSEDYDPSKDSSKSEESQIEPRKVANSGLFKEEKLYFDHYPNDRPVENKAESGDKPPKILFKVLSVYDPQTGILKKSSRHHKHNHPNHHITDPGNEEVLQRSKRDTKFNDPHGIFDQKPKEEVESNVRQRRQYYMPQSLYQPFPEFNPWSSSGVFRYYVTPNVIQPVPAQQQPSNFYLPTQHASGIKYPIRGIYYNPVSVPGSFGQPKPDIPISFDNRFGDRDTPDYFEDLPVWGVRYENIPSSNAIQPPRVTTPRPVTTSTPPPLLHGRDRGQNNNNRPPSTIVERPTPQPVVTTRRPTARPTTTPRPTTQELSKCVWAIVSCCQRDNTNVRYQCFEQLGCSGAFWGLNPCANEIQDDALDAADRYFD